MKSEKPTSKERIEHILNAVQIIQSFTTSLCMSTMQLTQGFKNIIEEILVKEFN